MKQYITLEDTVYFWFASNDTSGSGDDGASPLYDVRLAGAAAGAAPVLSGSGTLLTHVDYPAGAHEVAVAATAANGFAADNTYGVFCTLAVDSQNPTGFIGSFDTMPVEANVKQVSDDSTAADNLELDYDGTGYDKSNSTIGTVTTVTNLSTAAINAVADQVWDETLADHLAAGSTGSALNAAGASGDPWATNLPGSYTDPQAGYIIGTYLDAKVSATGSGPGVIEWTYTLTEDDNITPIADANIKISTDSGGLNIIANKYTDQNGVATFYLNAGTVYVWRQKSGFDFVNPDTEVVA